MDVRSLESALAVVTEEMRGTEREFEQLKLKRERLQAIVVNLTALLDERSQKPTQQPIAVAKRGTVEIATSIQIAEEVKPSWKIIQEVFPKNGGNLTVPEIHKLVNANGAVIPNPDAIRVAMRRHPEVFNNVNGRFSLVNPVPLEGAFLKAEEATEVAS